jgi:hypothetical protein
VYLFCKKAKHTAKEDFAECVKSFFDEDWDEKVEEPEAPMETDKKEDDTNRKPRVHFSYYYSHLDSNERIENNLKKDVIPSNLYLIGGSRVELDFDFHIEQAKKIFRQICPTEDFMPKPPEPEDIIFDSNDTSAITSSITVTEEDQSKETMNQVKSDQVSEENVQISVSNDKQPE